MYYQLVAVLFKNYLTFVFSNLGSGSVPTSTGRLWCLIYFCLSFYYAPWPYPFHLWIIYTIRSPPPSDHLSFLPPFHPSVCLSSDLVVPPSPHFLSLLIYLPPVDENLVWASFIPSITLCYTSPQCKYQFSVSPQLLVCPIFMSVPTSPHITSGGEFALSLQKTPHAITPQLSEWVLWSLILLTHILVWYVLPLIITCNIFNIYSFPTH